MDVMTTIHEYMHATSRSINPYHFVEDKYVFGELDTSFIEIIAADYLDKLFKTNGTIIKAFNHMERSSEALELTDTFKIIDYEDKQNDNFITNKQLKCAAKMACNLSGEELEELLYMPDTEPETYVISYIMAVELYDLYLQDQEKALFILHKIIEMNCDSLEDYYKEIKKLNLIPNMHMKEYHDGLQNDINNLIRIKKKR